METHHASAPRGAVPIISALLAASAAGLVVLIVAVTPRPAAPTAEGPAVMVAAAGSALVPSVLAGIEAVPQAASRSGRPAPAPPSAGWTPEDADGLRVLVCSDGRIVGRPGDAGATRTAPTGGAPALSESCEGEAREAILVPSIDPFLALSGAGAAYFRVVDPEGTEIAPRLAGR